MANRNWASGGKIYSMHVMPILLDCNFIVDSTNGNGLGIRSLKGPAIKNVFMNTSAPLAGSGNPNPAAGTIVVQFADNYNRSFSGFDSNVSPLSGSPLTSVTSGTAVVIVALSSTTAAQWQALGLPIGIAPALGVAFVPTSSAAIPGGGAVEIAASAGTGIMSIETLGDPNTTIAPNPSANQGFGAQIILQCRNSSGSIAAPANGSVISLAFYLSSSSVLVQGE